MAQPMHCDGCDGAELATLLITNITTGDILALGPTCIPEWATAIGAGVAEQLAHNDVPDDGDTPADDGSMIAGISPSNPATYPPAHTDPDADPHAPAETGPSSPSDVPVPTDPNIDPEHPHAPAITGPGTYEEEGGGIAPPPPPNPAAPAELPPSTDPADTQPVEQAAPQPAFL